MRASPPIEVALTRFGLWRAGVLLAAFVTVAAVGAWLMLGHDQLGSAFSILSLVVTLAVVAAAASAARVKPTRLTWNGSGWQLSRSGVGQETPVRGEVSVAIDLGVWMLLRFVAGSRGRRRCVVWLPVQRRGLEAQWHALRCAVCSPQPGRAVQ